MGLQIPPWKGAILRVEGQSIAKYRDILQSAVICAKTTEPIKMPFGLRIWMGPRNHVLDVGPDGPQGAIFRGKYVPRHARRHSTMSCEKNSEPIEFGLWTLVGPRNHVLHGAGHISAAWRIRLNRPCSAAVQKAAESIEMPVGMYTGGPKMVE